MAKHICLLLANNCLFLDKIAQNFCYRIEFRLRQSPVDFEILQFVNMTSPSLTRFPNAIGFTCILYHKVSIHTVSSVLVRKSQTYFEPVCQKSKYPTRAFRICHFGRKCHSLMGRYAAAHPPPPKSDPPPPPALTVTHSIRHPHPTLSPTRRSRYRSHRWPHLRSGGTRV